MKFKTIEVKDTIKRQITMEIASEKEAVLYAQTFTSDDNTNHEFVIGLPLTVRDYNQEQLDHLATELSAKFKQVTNTQFAIAIHSKKMVDEVHFHISYLGDLLDEDVVYDLYS